MIFAGIQIHLSNRETAILIWLILFLGFVARYPQMRKLLVSFVRAMLAWKLVAFAILAWLWIVIGVSILAKLEIWESIHLKDTIIWAAFSGNLIAFQGMNTDDPIGKLGSHIAEQFKLTTLIVFYSNWGTFPLVGELLLFPILALLGGSLALAGHDKELRQLVPILQWIIGLIGLGMIIFVSMMIIREPENFFNQTTMVSLCLPFILAIWAVPVGYAFSLVSGYEQIFIHLRNSSPDLRFYSFLKVAELGHFHATRIRRMDRLMAGRASWEESQDDLDIFFVELRKTLLDPDNKDSRDFIWPKTELIAGEMRYASLEDYLAEVDPLFDDLIRLWESTAETFSHSDNTDKVTPALSKFLAKNWHEMERIHLGINELNQAPEVAERFDRELHAFCYDLEHVFWLYSPENISILEESRRGFLVFDGYRSATKQFERLLIKTRKLYEFAQVS